jgi:hypothetical protein
VVFDESREQKIRALLSQLSGVEGVQIQEDAQGRIQTLAIQVSNDIDARRLTRDVESALLSGLGLTIDHRAIAISPNGFNSAQNGSQESPETRSVRSLRGESWQEPSQPGVSDDRRIRFLSARCLPDGELYVEITVELQIRGETYAGQIRDADTPRGRLLAAARATLRALAPTLEGEMAFVLEGLEEFTVQDAVGILAILGVRSGHHRSYFHGSAIIRQDPVEAAVRAVLDALNRHWAGRTAS